MGGETLGSFQQFVAPAFTRIRVLDRQIAAASEARDRLLPKLMTGEVKE